MILLGAEAVDVSLLSFVSIALGGLISFIVYLVATHMDVRSIKKSQIATEVAVNRVTRAHNKLERRVLRVEIGTGIARKREPDDEDTEQEEGSEC